MSWRDRIMLLFPWILCLIFAVAGIVEHQHLTAAERLNHLHPLRATDPQEPLIHPLLACDLAQDPAFPGLQSLQNTITRFIHDSQAKGDAKDVSVYLREYGGGGWLTIGENNLYSPASLYKVPIMITILKQAEKQPELLNRKLLYTAAADSNTGEYFKPSVLLESGKSYSVEQLLEHMIAFSDNNALDLLVRNVLDERSYFEVGSELRIHFPIDAQQAQDHRITVNAYAYFFRILYNATYLSREMSEKALTLLTHSDFARGIRSSIPASVPIAHKFGERSTDTDKELHDCGIVYTSPRPYLLCMMTDGNNFERLSAVIQSIAQMVYVEHEKAIRPVAK